MFTERKVWQQIYKIGKTVATPLQKAKEFLKISRSTRALARKLMDFGFASHAKGEAEKSRKFWSSAATMLSLSESARKRAKSALGGKERIGYELAPPGMAVPTWERQNESGAPQAERSEHGS